MFRKFTPPLIVSAILITVLSIITINYETIAQQSEANQDYFIKPIPQANLVIVEPNYGQFYNPDKKVEGDVSGEILYNSLEEIKQNYQLKNTKMVRFERKGKMIPNLYVYVDSLNPEMISDLGSKTEVIAEKLNQ